ncbi:MAG: glycosyltransferase family 4 protein [Ornithinimicrobium sp.]
MRILHVLEPATAGVPRLVSYIVREQIAAGHDVCVLSPAPLPHSQQFTWVPWAIRRRRPTSYLRSLVQLHNVHSRFQPDVVHAHSFFAGLLTRLPGSLLPATPLVYQPHAWAFDVFGGRARWLVETWERFAGRRTSVVVTNCQDELQRGRRAGVTTEGQAVGVAVDIEGLSVPTAAERAQSRANLSLGPGPIVLLLGRIAHQKGQDQLVRHWNPQQLPAGTRLVLVGQGDVQPLIRAAGDRWGSSILHVGGTADIRPWLWAADVMVIPSRYETVSLVAGEAMATGLPVVATDFDGAAEVLGAHGDEPAGVVVGLADMDALMRAIRLLLVDRDHRDRLAAHGRRRAVRYCSPQSVERALRDVYSVLIPAAKVP